MTKPPEDSWPEVAANLQTEIEQMLLDRDKWREVADQQEKMIGRLQVENTELRVRLNTEIREAATKIEQLKAELKREQDRMAYINSTVWGVGPGSGWPT